MANKKTPMQTIKDIHEIIKEIYPSTSLGDFGFKEALCMEVAERVKKEVIKDACKWLEESAESFVLINHFGDPMLDVGSRTAATNTSVLGSGVCQ